MRDLLQRLATEWRTRGPAGFMRFVALRLLQWRSDVLYQADPARLADAAAGPAEVPGETVVWVHCGNLGSAATAAVEAAVLGGANHAYRQALCGADQLLAIVDEQGYVASYGFVLFESFYKQVLREAADTPMIGNCFTDPGQRGRGYYPRLLRAACRRLADEGYRRVIITCAPDNLASVRGIEKAGFRRVRTLSSVVLAARWIAWQRIVDTRQDAP